MTHTRLLHSIWCRGYVRLGTVLTATCLVVVVALITKLVILPHQSKSDESEALNNQITRNAAVFLYLERY